MVEEEILWNYLSYMILIFEETGNGQVVQHELEYEWTEKDTVRHNDWSYSQLMFL